MGRGEPVLNWVVALKPEAQAVIERFGLSPAKETGLFPVYRSKDSSIQLVVSGPGRVNAAAATAFLACTPESRAADTMAWINFGIAGSGEGDFGNTFLAGKLESATTNQSWYPVASWSRKNDLSRRTVVTFDQPCEEYPDGSRLVEMEAAGFYPIALRVSGAELCQVLKVVSDDPEHPIHEISKALANRLCREALVEAENWTAAFLALAREEAERLSDPPGYQDCLEAAHFSVTQQHQLRRLLQKRHSILPEKPLPGVKGTSREILAGLRAEIAGRKITSS